MTQIKYDHSRGPASWEVDAHLPKPKGETRARRSYCTKELTMRPSPSINTVHDIMLYAGRVHGKKLGFGAREVLEVVTEERSLSRTDSSTSSKPSLRRPVELYRLSPLSWMSYEEALQDVRDLGCGLRDLGAGSRQDGQYFGIYASTSRNWMFMAQASAFNGVPICTVYDTAALPAVQEAFNEARIPALYTNAELLPNVARLLSRTPILRLIVYDGQPDRSTLQTIAQYPQVKIVSIDHVRELGRTHTLPQAERALRDDVYCLMYTSGGSGTPKGSLLTHGNVVAAVASIERIMGEYLQKEDCYLAFMPQAHILEFAVEMTFLFLGLPIAYGRIKTLSDAGVVKGCKNDMLEVRPSIMVGVPTLWELMRKAIISKVDGSGGLKKTVFNIALKAKTAAQDKSIPGLAGLTDAMVFKKVAASTGGRLRTIFNGGAPLAPSTQKFLSAAFVTMIQGYGLTEGTAMACILHPELRSIGSAGGPVPGVEIKLVDRLEPHLGYSTDSNPPQGEVYLRGPAIFKGYFNSEFDSEVFTPDMWLKTGDIGQWNPDGTLTLIDRAKNHFQLADGKRVALEHLESIYKTSPIVFNACIIASPKHMRPAMVVVVHPEHFYTFARKHGIPSSPDSPDDIDMLCLNSKLNSQVLKELNNTARKAGLKGHELLEAVILTADEWTPESGLLTAAQKLRRSAIEGYYADAINRVYTTYYTHTHTFMPQRRNSAASIDFTTFPMPYEPAPVVVPVTITPGPLPASASIPLPSSPSASSGVSSSKSPPMAMSPTMSTPVSFSPSRPTGPLGLSPDEIGVAVSGDADGVMGAPPRRVSAASADAEGRVGTGTTVWPSIAAAGGSPVAASGSPTA